MSRGFQAQKVESGDLYQVSSNNLWSTGENNKSETKDEYGRRISKRVNFNLGEILEIRYPYQWHVRTEDGKYFHIKPEDLEEHCKPYGKIKGDVKSANNKSLEDILKEKLFDKAILCVVTE